MVEIELMRPNSILNTARKEKDRSQCQRRDWFNCGKGCVFVGKVIEQAPAIAFPSGLEVRGLLTFKSQKYSHVTLH